MIIEAPKVKYEVVGNVLSNKANDIYICTKLTSTELEKVTLIAIHDKRLSRQLIEMFAKIDAECHINYFTWKNEFCMVFPHEDSRLIKRFLPAGNLSAKDYEEILAHIILACLSCQLPFPVLYLALKQYSLNLYIDNRVTINYQLDFSDFNPCVTEIDCIQICINNILLLFTQVGINNLACYQVISNKAKHNAYRSFLELYHDIKNTGLPIEKTGFIKRFSHHLREKSYIYYNILKAFCVILGVLAILMFLSQIFLGDIPFLRIFNNTFKVIGDRTLYR